MGSLNFCIQDHTKTNKKMFNSNLIQLTMCCPRTKVKPNHPFHQTINHFKNDVMLSHCTIHHNDFLFIFLFEKVSFVKIEITHWVNLCVSNLRKIK